MPWTCAAWLGFATLFLLSATSRVHAGTVEGLQLRIAPYPGHGLTFKVKDTTVDSGNFGSTGDPRCDAAGGGGASIRVNGASGNEFTITLPCQGWRSPNGSASSVFNTDYIYRDRSGASCSKVVVKHGHFIQVRCRSPHVTYPLLGGPQGNIDVTLRLGSDPVRNCATFGPPPTKVVHDGSNGKQYLAKHAPAPASCTSP